MTRGTAVVITLSVRDQISGHLRGIRSQFDGLRSPIAGLNAGMRGIGATAGSVGATIRNWSVGIAGAAFALGGMMKLMDGFKSAMKAETSALGASNNLAGAFKIPLAEAQKVNAELNKSIRKDAMSLPGTSKDFISISDGISGSVSQTVNGNIAEFTAMMKTVVPQLGVVAQGAVGGGLNSSQVSMGVNKYMSSGSGFAEIKQLELWEKNPQLTAAVQANMKLRGILEKDWGKVNATTKLEILKASLAQVANPAYIAALRKTTGATLGELQDTFFDDVGGIFGWLREVKMPNSSKMTTALQSFQVFLASIQDFTTAIGTTIGIDPMQAVSDLFRGMGKTIRDITAVVVKGSALWNDLTYIFTKKVTDSLTGLSDSIGKIDWASIGFNFGDSIAKILLDDKLGIALEKTVTGALNGLGAAIFEAIRSAGNQFLKWIENNTRVAGFNGVVPTKPGELPAASASETTVKRTLGLGKTEAKTAPGTVLPVPKTQRPWGTVGGSYESDKLSSLPAVGNTSQQVAYNSVTINGANMTDGSIVAAINRAWGEKQSRVMA